MRSKGNVGRALGDRLENRHTRLLLEYVRRLYQLGSKTIHNRAVVITTFSRFVLGLKPYVFFEHIKLISKKKMTLGHI